MSPLWTAEEAASATGGRARGTWEVGEVAIDTRAMPPDALFVALRGEHRDGHAFVPDALVGGAVAMVAHRGQDWPAAAPLLEVGDTLRGLEALGRAARARSPARIAAITGSAGKTSTKEALRHVLERQAPTHASAASHNNHWGVPLSLARLPREARYGVFEIGMNHAGEIATLSPMVRPHVAVITRIAPAHLELLGSIEAIADAKSEIFAGLAPGGVAVLPADDAQFPRLAAAARSHGAAMVTFGTGADADWLGSALELEPECSRFVAGHASGRLEVMLGAPGRHWVSNALAVLAAATALGADAATAAAALADVAPGAGRGARRALPIAGGSALLLDESYNANPASMRAAIDVLGRLPGRRLAALGDMLELGPTALDLHAALAEPLMAAGVDTVFTCGSAMSALHEALPAAMRGRHAPSSAELAAHVAATLRPGDVLLVKGSLGSRMKAVVDAVASGS